MRLLNSQMGETLVETLVSVLIVTLSILFLATAVVSSAKVNDAVKNDDVSFVEQPSADSEYKVDVNGTKVDATLHQTGNGYYYYDAA